MSCEREGGSDLGPEADHHRGVERHHQVAERRARVPASVVEDLVDEVRGAVQHLRDLGELLRAADVTLDADDLADPVELSGRRLQLGDAVQGAEASGLVAVVGRLRRADLARYASSSPRQGSW